MNMEIILNLISLLFFSVLIIRIFLNILQIVKAQKKGESKQRELLTNIVGFLFTIYLMARELIEFSESIK